MTEEKFEDCIKRIREGDRSGLREIYEEYLPYLYKTVLSIVQNREDAEDVTSDFFIKLWSLADKYKPGNGHKGYLATIARNMAVDHLRKNRREILQTDRAFEGDAPSEEPNDRRASGGRAEIPEDTVVEKLSIQEALGRLKPEERQIIDMKVLGEMTFKEISQLLHIPMGTVTWRYQDGMKKLRRYGYE